MNIFVFRHVWSTVVVLFSATRGRLNLEQRQKPTFVGALTQHGIMGVVVHAAANVLLNLFLDNLRFRRPTSKNLHPAKNHQHLK